MIAAEFVVELEGYYGHFQRAEQKKHVLAYLLDVWTPGELAELFRWCLETIPAKYNYVPDIAAFEEIRPKLREKLYLTANQIEPARQITEDGEGYVSKEEAAALVAKLAAEMRAKSA